MIPSKEFLQLHQKIKDPQICIFFNWPKNSKRLEIWLCQGNGQDVPDSVFIISCKDEKQYEYYVALLQNSIDKKEKFLKQVKSRIVQY